MPVQRCFISEVKDTYFNLAAEEYFLKNIDDEVFMVYINPPSVVVGKHQNLLKEINVPWCCKHNITLSRRLSGGGTVYQDLGNINFSFILNCPNLEKVNYKRFTYPVIKALKHLGINAENSDRNDLLINNLKISGNAMHIFKNRVLCHGTLLFKSDLKDLSSALKNNGDHYLDKSIKSVPSRVVNISDFVSKDLSENHFTEQFFNKTIESLDYPKVTSLSSTETDGIKKLSDEKYSTWEWIYGYSPKYQFRNKLNFEDQMTEFSIGVEKGIIREINAENISLNNLLNSILHNTKHDYNAIKSLFINKGLNDIFPGYSPEDFCRTLF